MPRAPLPKAIGCGRQAPAEQGRGPDGGGGASGSGRVCEISELTLGAGLRKPGFLPSGVLGHAPKRALGQDLRQAGAPVPALGPLSTQPVSLCGSLSSSKWGGAHDSPETEGLNLGIKD